MFTLDCAVEISFHLYHRLLGEKIKEFVDLIGKNTKRDIDKANRGWPFIIGVPFLCTVAPPGLGELAEYDVRTWLFVLKFL